MIPQPDFEKLSEIMKNKGIPLEAFEILADIRESEMEYYELYKELLNDFLFKIYFNGHKKYEK